MIHCIAKTNWFDLVSRTVPRDGAKLAVSVRSGKAVRDAGETGRHGLDSILLADKAHKRGLIDRHGILG